MDSRKYHSDLFMFLSIVFVVCLLLSNILAAKLIKIGDYSVTAGVIIFPISYIISDILAEVYGYKQAKKIILYGFLMNFLMVIVFFIAIVLPAPVWFENGDAFNTILGTTPRACIAGFTAYLIGSIINAKVLVKMKGLNNNKFGIRAIISTIFGETADSFIFVFIVFLGVLPIKQMIIMILIQVVFKTLYEVICLPLTTFVVNKVKKYETPEFIVKEQPDEK